VAWPVPEPTDVDVAFDLDVPVFAEPLPVFAEPLPVSTADELEPAPPVEELELPPPSPPPLPLIEMSAQWW
jgi:hypothetical protein